MRPLSLLVSIFCICNRPNLFGVQSGAMPAGHRPRYHEERRDGGGEPRSPVRGERERRCPTEGLSRAPEVNA